MPDCVAAHRFTARDKACLYQRGAQANDTFSTFINMADPEAKRGGTEHSVLRFAIVNQEKAWHNVTM